MVQGSVFLANPDGYRMMFQVNQSTKGRDAELSAACARARRHVVRYVTPVFRAGAIRARPLALGQVLWAATHGLVLLRLSGLIADDAALRRLHERSMSSLARGADRVAPARMRMPAFNTASSPPSRAPRANSLST